MQHFVTEIEELKEKLLTMASYAEAAVRSAVQAVTTRDYDLALRVKAEDEVIDQFEVEVDDLAIRLLARAPLASDLRLIIVAMKLSQNLERVGDEATQIAKRARNLSEEPPLKLAVDVPRMADLALEMLKQALDLFMNYDPAAARELIPQDEKVDEMNKRIQGELTAQMVRDPESISRCLNLMVAVKSLERVADHAKNVAEEVVFLHEGRDIRHGGRAWAARPSGATR
jgi:phosphate transport system protein